MSQLRIIRSVICTFGNTTRYKSIYWQPRRLDCHIHNIHNAGLVTLCADKKVIFADSTPSFTLGDGSVNDGYLHRDGIHLTHAAVNRLAKSLRLKKRNDASGVCSGERKPQYQHPHPPTALNHGGDAEWTTVRRRGRPAVSARRVSGSTRVSCHFCGEEGHSKDNCRHGRPIECHACHRPGHKSKLCPH